MFRSIISAVIFITFSAAFTMAIAQPPPDNANGGAPRPPGIAVGTVAADGIGVTVGPAGTAGELPNGPWVDQSVIKPLQAGAKIPTQCVVKTVEGTPFNLNAAVASKRTILIFYRGGWCPFCNAHLRDVQNSVPALQAMGYQILAISSDTPEVLRATTSKDKLSYQLLSDSQIEVAAKFGLKYQVTANYLDHLLKDHQTDLTAQNGGNLLTPGAYILDQSGTIRFAYVNNNYAVRISQAALLKAAREALK